jgi:hypothetical protein
VDQIAVRKNVPQELIHYKVMEMKLEEIVQDGEFVIMAQDCVDAFVDFMARHVTMK